jgi:hypothetical protein
MAELTFDQVAEEIESYTTEGTENTEEEEEYRR